MSSPTEHPDRRRFSRISFQTQTHIAQGNSRCAAELIDISLKGVLLQPAAECALDLQQPITVSVALSDDAVITMQTTLTRTMGSKLGLNCTSIDVESISHLRRLIELNLGDASACERELHELSVDHSQTE